MKKIVFLFFLMSIFASCVNEIDQPNSLRAPAYPLVTIDPYTSAWSMGDKLYESNVKHWTGEDFPLIGAIKVDGTVYRFMGVEDSEYEVIVPMAHGEKWYGKYTETAPSGEWTKEGYNDSSWSYDQGAFGTFNEKTVSTKWTSRHIWVRREVIINEDLKGRKVYLSFSNDDIAEFYINGIKVHETGRRCNHDAIHQLTEEEIAALKCGKNVISATCENTGGFAIIDFGILVEREIEPSMPITAIQHCADVQATQTHYNFTCGPVDLRLSFSAPLFLENLSLVSRPVNYISYETSSNDGAEHEVEVYFEASPRWAVNKKWQETSCETFEKDGLTFLKAGSLTQNILASKGDDIRIDWGYFYLAGESQKHTAAIGAASELRKAFAKGSMISNESYDEQASCRMAITREFKKASNHKGHILIGYDDIYSIQYFGENLRPYWNADGKSSIEEQFRLAEDEYSKLIRSCDDFDKKLMRDAEKAGGRKYAELCALAYRQAIHAHKLVIAPNGDLLWLSKENNSNGSIGTVDVTYPSAPLFLLYNPELVKGLMNHIFYYSESGKWTKPFPAHDVGTYPIANGQTYGGDMPVEEAGNMLSLAAALCYYTNNADYVASHWETLTTWVEYLEQFGLDPENQLCTDDFAGHFAHNANLSVKAIIGIASYGYMAKMLGKDDIAINYTEKARDLALQWMEMADDGDHYRLTFDKEGTWSQKYNLVWDKLLGLNIFPDSVMKKELAYYLTKQNKYGLPLDNRRTYTKTDWIMWTATMSDNMEEFNAFIDPIHKFMNETEVRVPMSDWIFTDKPRHTGFKARSVVGGYFIKLLED